MFLTSTRLETSRSSSISLVLCFFSSSIYLLGWCMVQAYQVVNKSVVTTAGGADRPLHGWLCIGAVKIIYSIVISIVYSNNAVATIIIIIVLGTIFFL